MRSVEMDSEPAAMVRETLVTLGNALLDEFYQEFPGANAYGASYDASQEANASWYLGRENGASGAESDDGIDFWYRKFTDLGSNDGRQRPSEEYEYLCGDYGWKDGDELLEERQRLRQLFEAAVDEDLLTASDLEAFEAAFDAYEQDVQEWRKSFSLADVATCFRQHEADTLLDLLGHGDEEGRVVWSLLFSKGADGSTIENSPEVRVFSEADSMMFVRSERIYIEDDGTKKEYPYGAVIGYDDTPERFFVHRISSDPDLRDPETGWTMELVKEKMGFDANLEEVATDELPFEQIIRVQGDLAVVRHDYEAAQRKYCDTLLEEKRQAVVRDVDGFLDAHPEYEELETLSTKTWGGKPSVSVNGRVVDGTPDLKALQEELNIEEETVRDRMRPDWKQLTANRRQDLLNEILAERVEAWALQQSETTAEVLAEEARQKARDALEGTRAQINAVHGNHTVVLGPATEHPNPSWGNEDTLGAYVVPLEATGVIIHDEHANKELALGPGVYEFRFLQGYEDQWWM